MNWHKIETAPKDVRIIAWGVEFCSEASNPVKNQGCCICEWNGGGSDYEGEDWWEVDNAYYRAWARITHWMPLPSPPEDT